MCFEKNIICIEFVFKRCFLFIIIVFIKVFFNRKFIFDMVVFKSFDFLELVI